MTEWINKDFKSFKIYFYLVKNRFVELTVLFITLITIKVILFNKILYVKIIVYSTLLIAKLANQYFLNQVYLLIFIEQFLNKYIAYLYKN